MKRVVQIVVRDYVDTLPVTPDTPEGALAVVRWAAPSLTEEEAFRVRDVARERLADVSTAGFARVIRDVLGCDVVDADGRAL